MELSACSLTHTHTPIQTHKDGGLDTGHTEEKAMRPECLVSVSQADARTPNRHQKLGRADREPGTAPHWVLDF